MQVTIHQEKDEAVEEEAVKEGRFKEKEDGVSELRKRIRVQYGGVALLLRLLSFFGPGIAGC